MFSARSAWLTAAFVVAVSVLSTFTLTSPTDLRRRGSGTGALVGEESELAEGQAGEEASGSSGGSTSSSATRTGSKTYDCSKGQNAGATDTGVTAREVRLAATVVTDGIAEYFLKDAQHGIEAVRTRVNQAGGVCGRIIRVDYQNDGWNPTTGLKKIEGFIGEKKYFGLAVNPSSEGLRNAIDGGLIKNNRFPVVGADGMLIGQYLDPWVWPVATSTSSVMHIMAKNAWDRGARKFGIVWESGYRFGVEGHAAFQGTLCRLAHADPPAAQACIEKGTASPIRSDVSLKEGQTDYSNQASQFIGGCGGVDSLKECEFMALLLEPVTASQWFRNGGLGNGRTRPTVGIGAPQPLFLDSFARDCASYCAGMWVWTSFKPPIDPFRSEGAVSTYFNEIKRVANTADPNNPHVEGAYAGMMLLVEALQRMGPAPTAAAIQKTLDSMTLETKLGPPITFKPGSHFAAVSAQAFEAIVNNNSFTRWRYTNSGFLSDSEVGKDVPSS